MTDLYDLPRSDAQEQKIRELTQRLAAAEARSDEQWQREVEADLEARLAAAEAGHHCPTCGGLLIVWHERLCGCTAPINTFVREVPDDEQED